VASPVRMVGGHGRRWWERSPTMTMSSSSGGDQRNGQWKGSPYMVERRPKRRPPVG
jgi:hypothetical protein